MSRISPKPVIETVLKTWRVPPGMLFALVEDVERRVWIVESCPAGTQVWTVEQATALLHGPQTRHALEEAVRMGRQQLQKRQKEAPQGTHSSSWRGSGGDLLERRPSQAERARLLRRSSRVEKQKQPVGV